eukprot:6491721-Prymnesium_polylepis.1
MANTVNTVNTANTANTAMHNARARPPTPRSRPSARCACAATSAWRQTKAGPVSYTHLRAHETLMNL